MILEHYSDKVVHEATDPFTGLQSHCKFPPNAAEVKQFCDELLRRSTYAAEYDARSKKQLDEREAFERDEREPLEHRKAVAERIKAELRAAGFKFAGDQPTRSSVDAERAKLEERLMRNLGVAQQDAKQLLDAVPDQPDKADYWQGVRWPT